MRILIKQAGLMNRFSFANKFLVIGALCTLSTGALLALYINPVSYTHLTLPTILRV